MLESDCCFALRRLILIDSYRKGAVTELKLDGHTSITGANGIGKTSLLRLIPLFYGESPNKLVQGGGVNKSFVQYYLPHTTSYIIFEYSRLGKLCMAVLHASSSGESVYYRFIDQPFALERFTDEDGNLIEGPNLLRHIRKRGEFCSEQITAISDYRAIIQNTVSSNREHRTLAANFSFVGAGARLSHIEKIVTGMFSRVTNFRDIKRMIVSCIVDDKTSVKLETSNATMKDWVREYRAYAHVMEQSSRMQAFHESITRHKEAERQLRLVHADFLHLKEKRQEEIELAEEKVRDIRKKMRTLEEQTTERLREINEQLGVSQGLEKSLRNALQALEKQYHAYEGEGLPELAELVDSLPQLRRELAEKEARERALLGASEELSNRYAEMRNKRIEDFHAFERMKNAEKDRVRSEGQKEEQKARLAADEAWKAIAAEFDQQEAALIKEKDQMVERLGGLKRAAEFPQPDPEVIATKERARADYDKAVEAFNKATAEYEEAKRTYQSEIEAFRVIEGEIQSLQEQEKKEQAVKSRLLSLKNAKEGTLLHFLRENHPGWTRNIAKVISEDLLLRTDLIPTLVSEEALSLYGVGLDLAVLDTPKAADEQALQLKIEEVERAIERLGRAVRDKEKELEAHAERISKAKALLDEKQLNHIQSQNAERSSKAALEAAERALTENIRQAGIRAQQQLQEAQQAVDKVEQQLRELKSARNARWRTHKDELNKRIEEIDARIKAEIAEIDRAIVSAKRSCDKDIEDLNRELESALKAKGVDTASLEKLRKEKADVQEKAMRAHASEIKVIDWRRWLKAEWENRQEKEAELKKVQAEIKRLENQADQLRTEHKTKRDALTNALEKAEQEKAELERLYDFVVKRIERLASWPVNDINVADRPLQDQDTLEAEMDRLIKEIRDEKTRAHDILRPIERAFFEMPGSAPYQFYDKKRLELGPERADSPFAWFEPLKEWFEDEHENVRRLLLSQCRNFAAGIHEFHDRLDSFKRKVSIFSKDLRENMAASTRFRFINSVAVRITTSFDTLDGWDKIKRLDEEYSVWAGKDGYDLPDASFADAVEQVSDWLQGRHTLDVKLEDLLNLEIEIEEVGQPKKTVKDERQLRDASSNGLSYLILCVVFVGLINKIRGSQPVQLVWALDELRDLDLDNVSVLLDMLTDNHIYLVSAFPDPEPEILSLLKNRYAIQEGRRLAVFRMEEEDHV